MDPQHWMGAVKMKVQTADTNIIIIHTQSKQRESSIHNIAFSSEKVILSESEEKYKQIKRHLEVKTGLFFFLLEENVIKNYGLVFWPETVLKTL